LHTEPFHTEHDKSHKTADCVPKRECTVRDLRSFIDYTEINRVHQNFIGFPISPPKIPDFRSRFQIPFGIPSDLCWIPTGPSVCTWKHRNISTYLWHCLLVLPRPCNASSLLDAMSIIMRMLTGSAGTFQHWIGQTSCRQYSVLN